MKLSILYVLYFNNSKIFIYVNLTFYIYNA